MKQWKILKELDKYSISNCGRIKNNKTGKIKALGIHNGYYFISFEDYKNGKRPKAGGCRWKFIDNIIPEQNISPLKEGDVPLWQD